MGIPTNLKSFNLVGTDEKNDLLKAQRPLTDGKYNEYQFNVFGLDGRDRLYASGGPRNWAQLAMEDPTATLHVSNYLYGGAGNDRLYSSTGIFGLASEHESRYSVYDALYGGDGDDVYVLSNRFVHVFEDSLPGGGIDTIVFAQGGIPSPGSNFYLTDYANVENIRIQSSVRYKDVTINGNEANNTIWDNGTDGNISGDHGNDTIYGYGGHDTLNGDVGNDALFGGEGNDVLSGGIGDDRINGGSGDDNVYGDVGNDVLRGGNGADTLYGDDGNDVLIGGTGADVMLGGVGDDIFFVDDIFDVVFEAQESGIDTVISSAMTLRSSNFHNVESLQLRGHLNLDLYGGVDGMTLTGNDGNNRIYGGVGADVISGGDGDDRIVGSSGADTLSGGEGADVFVFNAASFETDANHLEYSSVNVLDFVSGEDTIDLSSGYWSQQGATTYFDYLNNTYLAINSTSFTIIFNSDAMMTFNLNGPVSVSDFLLFD